MSAPADESKSRPMTSMALSGDLDLDHIELPFPRERRAPFVSVHSVERARLYVFDFGAIVQDGRAEINYDVRSGIERATGRKCLTDTAETYQVLVDPTQGDLRPRVGWDRVVLHDGGPTTLEAVALLLAQSAALERYEKTADRLTEEALALSQEIALRGRLPRSTRALMQRIGKIMAERLELASWFFLLDRPEAAWEDARVYQLYMALFDNLELTERHQAMLYKLEAVQTTVSTTIDMWTWRRSLALEVAIVALIAVEIALALVGLV